MWSCTYYQLALTKGMVTPPEWSTFANSCTNAIVFVQDGRALVTHASLIPCACASRFSTLGYWSFTLVSPFGPQAFLLA